MMQQRHTIPKPSLLEPGSARFWQSLQDGFPSISTASPDQLIIQAMGCTWHAAQACVLGKPAADVRTILEYACLFGTTHFGLAAGLLHGVVLNLEGHERPVPNKPIEFNHDFGFWSEPFWNAMILHDRDSMTVLLEAAEVLYGPAFAKQKPPFNHKGCFYLALHRGDLEAAEAHLKQHIQFVFTRKKASRSLPALPPLEVWQALLNGDAGAAQVRLQAALQSHQLFWDTKANRKSARGWIAFPLLAACVWAFDHGMDLQVPSAYLPRWLITGELEEQA